jgi:hypothetical protein
MSDVVGTAYVRIKALTDQLAKDIKSDVEKSLKKANLDKVAQSEGESFGEEFGDSTADSAEKTLKKRSKDIVPRDELNEQFGGVVKDAEKQFKQLDFGDAFSGVREDVEKLSSDLPKFDDVNIDVDVDSAGAEASLERVALESAIASKDIDIDVDVDSAGAEAALARVKVASKRAADDINNGPLAKAITSLDSSFKNLGSSGGASLGILKSKIALIGGAIIGALPYIQDVGSAVLSYATGLVAQIGFLGTALGGLGVAAAAAIGSAVAAALPIFLSFKAETETLLDFKDSLAAVGEEFMNIGVATQQTLLPALDEALFTLGDLVPLFSEYGLFVGRAVGNYAKLATGILVGETAQGRFRTILQSSLRILDMLLPTIINFGDILSAIWVAAAPAAERFAGAIKSLADRWAAMTTEGLRTGELTEKFDTWLDRALLLGSALGNLTGALGNILSVGANSASGLFVRFDEWAQRFRDFTESEAGQNRLALIFDNALSVMREVNGIAADLFDGIFGRIGELGGVDSMVASLQKFRDVIPQIQEFWSEAYDVIKNVVELFASNVWEKITQAWGHMSEPLGRLSTQILDLLAVMNESGAFEVFLDLMRILSDTLAVLLSIPGFGQFVAYFLAFSSAIRVAKLVLGPFVGIFGSFVGIIGKLIALNSVGNLVGVGTGLSRIASGARAITAAKTAGTLAEVGGAAKAAATKAGGLVPLVSGISSGLKFLGPYGIAAGIGIGAVGAAFFNSRRNAQEWKQEIRQVTEALGLLNDGLNITGEGVAKYIDESSRFETREQIDDLVRLGLTVRSLGDDVARGALTYVDFADAALAAGEVDIVSSGGKKGAFDVQVRSLKDLQEQYGLTNEALNDLAQGESVHVDGQDLILSGNSSLLESFKELNVVIGAAAKESINEFATNATNIELIGAEALGRIRDEVKGASDEEAAQIMVAAQDQLSAAAENTMGKFRTLSQATRDQAVAQATLADGTVEATTVWALLNNELEKQNTRIRENLDLFVSDDFGDKMGLIKTVVLDFINTTANIDLPSLEGLNVDELSRDFPDVIAKTDALFRALEGLPEDQFNAAAQAIGADAGALKEAMNGAQQAIIDLSNQALETLPSVGELLDEATSTTEDGTKHFDESGFIKGVNARTQQTKDFARNIQTIKEHISEDAARLAAQEGPEAAANLAKLSGTDPEGTKAALDAMEQAETDLKVQIDTVLGPGIRAQFIASSEIWGDGIGVGLGKGLNSDATLSALKNAGLDTLNTLAKGFQGRFVISPSGVLRFEATGSFEKTVRELTPGQKRVLYSATGGLVDTSGVSGMFKRIGTDIVPAMLTPGEFVNNRDTVDRLGVDFFTSLNSGGTPVVPVGGGGSQINASGWTIVAPSPEESARQMISRFRTMSYLLGGG